MSMINTPFPGYQKGRIYDFYGVCNNCFKLGGVVYEAIEDPCDGYRSYLETVKLINNSDLIFFRTPIARVTVREAGNSEYYSFDGWELVGLDDHVWLRYGTDNYDDYYPCFTFRYVAKER